MSGRSGSSARSSLDTLFESNGLHVPLVPDSLAGLLVQRSEWDYSTEPVATTPYSLMDFVREFVDDPSNDRVIVAHAGHGAVSWALCNYVVRGSVGVFIHSSWGSAMADEADDELSRSRFAERVARGRELLALASEEGLPDDQAVGLIMSDQYRTSWTSFLVGTEPQWLASDDAADDAMAAVRRVTRA